jgi:hypothetical protein
MKKLCYLAASTIAISAMATPASAAEYIFSYQSTSSLFGAPPQTLEGVFTTSDTPEVRSGETAFAITGISGALNGRAITGLFAAAGNPTYYYFTTGGTFLDGSGVRFNAGGFTNVAFFQPSVGPADQYRINGGGGISTFGNATSSLVAGAVPEPTTWMLMLLGMAGIGFSMRRKANQTLRVSYA